MAIPISELQKIAPSSIIELFELELVTALHGSNTTYRFHAGSNMNANGALIWNGNTYDRYPVEADGFEYTGNGQLPRPKIRVSNLLGTITAILLTVNSTSSGNDLNGAKLTRIRTLARYIDAANFEDDTNPYGTPDATAEFPREIYYLDRKVVETRDVVEWECAAAFDLVGVRAPKRQCIANRCQWVYRGSECGYTGPPIADINDDLLPGVTSSQAAIDYKTAAEAFDATVAPYNAATAALNTATNNLNSAQGNWYRAEVQYKSGWWVQEVFGVTSVQWAFGNVSLGAEYRRGSQKYFGYNVKRWEIERWAYDNSAVVAAQAAYNSALSTYNTAKSNYDSALTAKNNAYNTWLVSPQYTNDLNASGDACGKRLTSCKLRFGTFAELPYGSFPGVGTFFT